jgi:hypothetical protein
MNAGKRGAVLREYALQGLLLLLVLAAAFPGVFFRGEVAFPGDILFESLPWKLYAPSGWEHAENRLLCDMTSAIMPWYWLTREALRHGEWPLWNPLEFGGAPLLANWQSAVFYPPRALHSVLDIFVGFTVFVLLKLWLCGMNAYLCARAIGLRTPAARFMSIAWMLGGYNFVWCYWPVPDVCVWLPIVFLGTEWLIGGRYRRGFFAVLFGAVLSLLAGHPESAFVINLGICAYAVMRLLWDRRRLRDSAACLAVWGSAWLVALLVAAVQIIPFLEYLLNSYPPGQNTNMGAHPGLPLHAVLCLWIPRFFGATADLNYWGDLDTNRFLMNYAGVPVWLAATLLVARGPWERQSRARVACLAIVVAVFLCLTFEVPPFDLIHRLPLFNLLKRTYYIAFVMFALPVLGAIGLDRWFARPRKWYELFSCILGILLTNAALYLAYSFYRGTIRLMRFQDYLSHQLLFFWCAEAVFLIVLIVSLTTFRPRLFPALLAILLAADLLVAGRGTSPSFPRRMMYPETQLTRFLENVPKPCRIGLVQGMVPPGFMVPYGIQDISGYDALYPERIVRFQYGLKTDVWNAIEPVYNIEYYLHDPTMMTQSRHPGPTFPIDQTNRFEMLTNIDGLDVYKNKGAMPRAFLVGSARVISNREALLDAMRDPALKPAKEVLLEEPLSAPLPKKPPEDPGTATVVDYKFNRVVVEADAKSDCILVLGDAYYPGWRATIDGQPAPIFSAYYAFRGVRIPAGSHRIEFFYMPASLKAGLGISMATLIVMMICSLRALRREARAPARPRSRTTATLPAARC